MYSDPSNKLSRPRQLYTGKDKRDFLDIAKR
jgi:citrate synthase